MTRYHVTSSTEPGVPLPTKERVLLGTVSLGVYGSNAVFGQFARRLVAISFFHMKTVLELSPKGPLAYE